MGVMEIQFLSCCIIAAEEGLFGGQKTRTCRHLLDAVHCVTAKCRTDALGRCSKVVLSLRALFVNNVLTAKLYHELFVRS